ncbi:DUF2268 domain-containing putative Zn-dependent protease [Winogradskyella flava]|uniref:DUF2268 domain-containing putative Zn-dependent protease n=1 Tax=Winogradskyella flava TaxID=1884876 RepID=UPI002492674B|nr:DUF2268 domain-containing putative Zn-dependent protease [Winogradskyella flava]
MKSIKHIQLLVPILFMGLIVSCKKDAEAVSQSIKDLHLPNLNVLFEDFNTLDSTENYQGLANKLFTNNRDLNSSEMYVYAAWMYGKATIADSATLMLHKAIDNGMSNPKVLSKFELEGIIGSSENSNKLNMRLDSIQKELKNTDNFGIQLEAMDTFWSYFKKAKNDTSNAEVYFKEFIFNGPKELRDYYVIRYMNLESMKDQIIEETPEYYSYLETQFSQDSVLALKKRITGWMKNFKGIYPDAVFPKVYIVPGLLSSAGTASELGMFVGGDMFGKSANMPIEGMTEWEKEVIAKTEEMPSLIIHELMHFQQNYGDTKNTNNVLGSVFMEGVCDFMVELCTGIVLKNKNTDFLKDPKNLEMVCADFAKDKFTTDFSRWLYNGEIEDRPFDLGYTFGYLVSKSYYEKHNDKEKAIYELLNTDDYTEIYKNSDYAYLLN